MSRSIFLRVNVATRAILAIREDPVIYRVHRCRRTPDSFDAAATRCRLTPGALEEILDEGEERRSDVHIDLATLIELGACYHGDAVFQMRPDDERAVRNYFNERHLPVEQCADPSKDERRLPSVWTRMIGSQSA